MFESVLVRLKADALYNQLWHMVAAAPDPPPPGLDRLPCLLSVLSIWRIYARVGSELNNLVEILSFTTKVNMFNVCAPVSADPIV